MDTVEVLIVVTRLGQNIREVSASFEADTRVKTIATWLARDVALAERFGELLKNNDTRLSTAQKAAVHNLFTDLQAKLLKYENVFNLSTSTRQIENAMTTAWTYRGLRGLEALGTELSDWHSSLSIEVTQLQLELTSSTKLTQAEEKLFNAHPTSKALLRMRESVQMVTNVQHGSVVSHSHNESRSGSLFDYMRLKRAPSSLGLSRRDSHLSLQSISTIRTPTLRNITARGEDEGVRSRLSSVSISEEHDRHRLSASQLDFNSAQAYSLKDSGRAMGRFGASRVLVTSKAVGGADLHAVRSTCAQVSEVFSAVASDEMYLLKPTGYYEHTVNIHGKTEQRVALAYDLGPAGAPMSEVLSIYDAVNKADDILPLEVRVRLGLEAAKSVAFLHATGFVATGLDSDSWLLLPSNHPTPFDEDDKHAYLIGIEEARLVGAVDQGNRFKTRDELRPEQRLYHHPALSQRQAVEFDLRHDVHSLGAVLLELALWKPLKAIPALQRTAAGVESFDAEYVKQVLVREAEELYQHVGSKLMNVVIACFEIGQSTDSVEAVRKATFEHVVDVLQAINV